MAGTLCEVGPENDRWFTEVCRETYGFTLAYLLRRTPDPADAEDLVVETYAIAWSHIEEFRQTNVPQAWLLTVASRRLQNFRRGSRRRQGLSDMMASMADTRARAPDPALMAEQQADVASMETALATLPERDQQVLRMLAYESLTYAEIGLALGIRVSLVRNVVSRARRRLSQAMAEFEEPEISPRTHNGP